MNIGWIGLGKLGLPCALATAASGNHKIYGWDSSSTPGDIIRGETSPPDYEQDLDKLVAWNKRSEKVEILPSGVLGVVGATDKIIFVSVPTPHHPAFSGEKLMPLKAEDFDYTALKKVVSEISKFAFQLMKPIVISIASTVTPRTIQREILPLINQYVRVVYNPFFIALGTTIDNFLNPAFVLLGAEDSRDTLELRAIYSKLNQFSTYIYEVRSFETAELIKIAYNTYLTMKITWSNTMMEICDKIGADVDEVTSAVKISEGRNHTIGLSAGLGEGGPCRPRDLIAMEWLCHELDIRDDLFGYLAEQREIQMEWLAAEIIKIADNAKLDIVILGTAYKPNSSLTIGSPALLLFDMLDRSFDGEVTAYEPFLDQDSSGEELVLAAPHIFVIGTKHEQFERYNFPKGSVIVDPYGYIPKREGRTVHHIGRRNG